MTQLVKIEGDVYTAYKDKNPVCFLQAPEGMSKDFLEFYRKHPQQVYDEVVADETDPCRA